MAGKFPGANDLSAFWSNLRHGKESIVTLSEQELRDAGVSEKTLADPAYVRRAPLLDGIDEFDADFFGFPPLAARCWIHNTGCSCSARGMRSRTRAVTPRGSTARSACTEPALPAAISCTTCCRIVTRTPFWPRGSTSTSSACSCRTTRIFWQRGYLMRSTSGARASRSKPRARRRWLRFTWPA